MFLAIAFGEPRNFAGWYSWISSTRNIILGKRIYTFHSFFYLYWTSKSGKLNRMLLSGQQMCPCRQCFMMAFQSCSKSNPWLNTNFNLLASHRKWDLCCGLFSKMLNPAESLILPSSFPFHYFYLHSINIMLKNGSH